MDVSHTLMDSLSDLRPVAVCTYTALQYKEALNHLRDDSFCQRQAIRLPHDCLLALTYVYMVRAPGTMLH